MSSSLFQSRHTSSLCVRYIGDDAQTHSRRMDLYDPITHTWHHLRDDVPLVDGSSSTMTAQWLDDHLVFAVSRRQVWAMVWPSVNMATVKDVMISPWFRLPDLPCDGLSSSSVVV